MEEANGRSQIEHMCSQFRLAPRVEIHGPGGSLRWSTSTTTCLASAGADEKATPVSSISAGGEDKSRECRCTWLLRRPAGERHRPDHAGWLRRPQECAIGPWGSYSDARKGGGERWKEVIPYAHLSWEAWLSLAPWKRPILAFPQSQASDPSLHSRGHGPCLVFCTKEY